MSHIRKDPMDYKLIAGAMMGFLYYDHDQKVFFVVLR
jgi:hypothetical protein